MRVGVHGIEVRFCRGGEVVPDRQTACCDNNVSPAMRQRVLLARLLMGEPLRALRDPLAGGSGRARANREQHNQLRKQSSLGRFLATYGWRAYALPVLAVLTVVVLYQTLTSPPVPVADDMVKGPPTIGSAGTSIIGAPPRAAA